MRVCVYIYIYPYSRGSMQIEGGKEVEMYVDYLLSSLRPLMSLMRGPFTGALSYREKNQTPSSYTTPTTTFYPFLHPTEKGLVRMCCELRTV